MEVEFEHTLNILNLSNMTKPFAGLGNPSNRAVERETNLVLQSIFPLQSLGAFVSQPRMDKRTQLRELTAIVTGIRDTTTITSAAVISSFITSTIKSG